MVEHHAPEYRLIRTGPLTGQVSDDKQRDLVQFMPGLQMAADFQPHSGPFSQWTRGEAKQLVRCTSTEYTGGKHDHTQPAPHTDLAGGRKADQNDADYDTYDTINSAYILFHGFPLCGFGDERY
jgi:hypothetical protein